MDEGRAREGAAFRQGLPEIAGDGREGREALRHPAGERPDHRSALREAAGHDPPRIDGKPRCHIGQHLLGEGEFVAVAGGRPRKGPGAADAIGGDQRDAQPLRDGGEGGVRDHLVRGAAIAVEEQDRADPVASRDAGRQQDAVAAAFDIAALRPAGRLRRLREGGPGQSEKSRENQNPSTTHLAASGPARGACLRRYRAARRDSSGGHTLVRLSAACHGVRRDQHCPDPIRLVARRPRNPAQAHLSRRARRRQCRLSAVPRHDRCAPARLSPPDAEAGRPQRAQRGRGRAAGGAAGVASGPSHL